MRDGVEPELSQIALSVLHVVRERPGIHFRELARAADISSMGQLRHHLDHLQRRGLLFEIEDGRYKRFFVAGEQPAHLRKALTRFARPVPRRIGKLLLRRPLSRTELRHGLGCADSTLGYHLTRMTYLGDVVKTGSGNGRRYALSDPVTVRQALKAHEDGALSPAEAEAGSRDERDHLMPSLRA